MFQACQRHMRTEGTRFWRKSGISRSLFVRAGEIFEFRLRLDARPDRVRIVAAKCTEPGNAKLKAVGFYVGEIGGKLARFRVIDIASEPERDVIALRRDPPGARQRHAQTVKLVSNVAGDLDGGE
jgi:hypothetical protein